METIKISVASFCDSVAHERSRQDTTFVFVHAKDRKMDFTSNAPGARFGFIQNINCMPSPTGWQREGRLKSELSVGVFVPLERTHFLKLQGSFKTSHLIWRTCFREKIKIPVFPVQRGLYQQIKPFSHSKCCVVFVSLKLRLNRQTDLSKKFTTNLLSIRHGFPQKLWFLKRT